MRVAALALVASLALPSAVHAQELTLEVSAPADARARLVAQLTDLPGLRITDTERPTATVDELARGDADLCLFVRVGDALDVGLLDRRASRRLVERTALHEGDASAALETAALAARQWVREVLRGGALGVVTPPAEPTPEEPTEPAATATEEPSGPFFALDLGWRLAIDGSDEPSHGPSLGFAVGDGPLAIGAHVAIGLPQRWDLVEARIARTRIALSVVGHAQLEPTDWLVLAGRLRAGVVIHLRDTLDVASGLTARPTSVLAVPLIALEGGAGVRLLPELELRGYVGAEAWLAPPSHQVVGGESRTPWPVQPTFELQLRLATR